MKFTFEDFEKEILTKKILKALLDKHIEEVSKIIEELEVTELINIDKFYDYKTIEQGFEKIVFALAEITLIVLKKTDNEEFLKRILLLTTIINVQMEKYLTNPSKEAIIINRITLDMVRKEGKETM